MLPQTINHSPMTREDKMIHSDQQRAIAEVQAALVIAASRPRDEVDARERIMTACLNVNLANTATYNYPRGGQKVTGPSIRLAETCARHWGNMNYGFRELNRMEDVSQCEAFAWDLETNTKAVRQFQVRHIRDTRQGGKPLTDERDIYELMANMAQRRVRACIMEIIPQDIFDEAVEKCRQTAESALKQESGDLQETVSKMIKAFAEYRVSKEAIEKRFGRKVSALEISHVIDLRRIYTSIKDGMSEAKEWFEVEPEKSGLNEAIKGKGKSDKTPDENTQSKPEAEPETAKQPESGVHCPNSGQLVMPSLECNNGCEHRKGCPAFDEEN